MRRSTSDAKVKGKAGAPGKDGSWRASESWAGAWEKLGARRTVTLDCSEVVLCRKCILGTPTYRHHKGFDSFVGHYNKSILFSYYQWNDCVDLCEDCHCEIHFIYEPYVKTWRNRSAKGARTFREFLIKVCDEWLSGARRSPKVPKAYRDQFHQSLINWREQRGKPGTGSRRT